MNSNLNHNPNNKLVVTVLSVPGQPQLTLAADTTTDQVREIVAERFGQQMPTDSWMRPHDFRGQLLPSQLAD